MKTVILINSFLLVGLIFTVTLFNLYYERIKLRYYVSYFFISLISSCIVMAISPMLAIVVLSAVNFLFLIYIDRERKFYMFILSVLIYIIPLVSDFIVGTIAIKMTGYNQKQIAVNYSLSFILLIINGIFVYLISYSVGRVLTAVSFPEFDIKRNYKIGYTGLISFMLAVIIMYVNIMLGKFYNVSKQVLIVNFFMFIIYVATTILIFYMNVSSFKKQMELDNTKREFENIKEYTGVIENMYDEIRKFKHDYVNILISLDGYIKGEDTEGLKKYFYENIMVNQKMMDESNTEIQKLKYIKDIPLKGIVSSKLINGQSLDVKVKVDIAETIEKISVDTLDLCRILGILLDNGLEAAKHAEEPSITFAMINKQSSLVIVVLNSCQKDIPPIYKMFEKGFSTKGENRGFGLHIIKEMIDRKYTNVILNTSVENGIFKQELWIKNKDC